jgi:hypothetical protein
MEGYKYAKKAPVNTGASFMKPIFNSNHEGPDGLHEVKPKCAKLRQGRISVLT